MCKYIHQKSTIILISALLKTIQIGNNCCYIIYYTKTYFKTIIYLASNTIGQLGVFFWAGFDHQTLARITQNSIVSSLKV